MISAVKFALIFNDQIKVSIACQRQLIKNLALSDDMLTAGPMNRNGTHIL